MGQEGNPWTVLQVRVCESAMAEGRVQVAYASHRLGSEALSPPSAEGTLTFLTDRQPLH
jgi:hypothetical protein